MSDVIATSETLTLKRFMDRLDEMTEDDIDDLTACRDTDALVISAIFGQFTSKSYYTHDYLAVPHFTHDAAAAMSVIKCINEGFPKNGDGYRECGWDLKMNSSDWYGAFIHVLRRPSSISWGEFSWDRSMPLAICKTALKAVKRIRNGE